VKLETKHFGCIDIEEENIISFPEGLPGFEDTRKYVLLGKNDEESPFRWLQCVDRPDVAFAIIDPRLIKPDYVAHIESADIEILDIKEEDKALVYVILVVPEDITKMTANLKAPVIINPFNNMGKQVVLEKGDYGIKHYVFEELRKTGG